MPGLPKHIPDSSGKVRLEITPQLTVMAATDLVPCFYTGQDYRYEHPAEYRLRHQVREIQRQKLGKFIENGRIFLFAKRIVRRVVEICDGPVSAKSLLHFTRTRTDGEKLHYAIPMAGDVGIRRHDLRRTMDGKKSVLRRRLVKPSKRVPDEVAVAQMSAAFKWRIRTHQAIA